MDESERLVSQYLLSLNQGDVIFEPDGNIPPDFSLGDHIGVEVRRLNQNYEYPDGSSEGLEKLDIALWQRLEKSLPTIGTQDTRESWFVGLNFRRPVESPRVLDKKIKTALLAFMHNTNRSNTTLHVTPNFEINLARASRYCGSFFLLGESSDDDSGGWVMNEVERNLQLCITEKERKIAPHRHKYSEWWLVLPDHIDYSMEPDDRETFRNDVMPRIKHKFDKIVLIDPRDHRRVFVI